jgi:hypothetical protein
VTAQRRAVVSIDTIVSLLTARIHALVADLLPHGEKRGPEWTALNTRRGENTVGAFNVRLTGPKAGVWRDFGADIGGDALDLVAYWQFNGDKSAAILWSRQWLGIDSGSPQAIAAAQHQAQTDRTQRHADAAEQDEKKRRAAFSIYLSAQQCLIDTPVELYLASRNIDLASFDRMPRALRFHPALYCEERGDKLPAMVAAVNGPDGKFQTIHRTWLEQAGPGDWRKARLEKAKKVYSPYRGGCIRLARGTGGKAWADMPPDTLLDVTEGIEDGLTVAQALPEARVIAAISLGNAANIPLPPTVTAIRFWRQRDTKPGPVAAADRLVQHWLKAGLQVVIPDLPGDVKDVNEMAATKS